MAISYPSRLFFATVWRLWLLVPEPWRRRVYIKLALWYSPKRMGWTTRRLPFGLVLKRVYDRDPDIEVSNIRFIESQTSIPVPFVRDTIYSASSDDGLIVMDWIEGETLGEWVARRLEWPPEYAEISNLLMNGDPSDNIDANALFNKAQQFAPKVDLADAEPLFNDLRNALKDLRSLPPPSPTAISGLQGRPLIWQRDLVDRAVLPPLENVAAFHQKLLGMALRGTYQSRTARIMQLATPVLQKQYRICFTHSDLNDSNIIIRDGRIAGIIDWEYSGWYPEYWEYTTLCCGMIHSKALPIFWDAVGIFSGKYERELALEEALWACTGEFAIRPGLIPDYYLDQPM